MDIASKTDSLILRPAREMDMPAVQAIYAIHVLTGFGSFEEVPPSTEEMKRRWLAIADQGFPYLVAVDGATGQIHGYAYAGPYRPRSAYRYTVEDSVYVAPESQRKGVGRRLLGTLIDEASRMGKRQMIAVIGDSGNAASITLHRSLGFVDAGILCAVGYKQGRWVDSVFMRLALGPGDTQNPSA